MEKTIMTANMNIAVRTENRKSLVELISAMFSAETEVDEAALREQREEYYNASSFDRVA